MKKLFSSFLFFLFFLPLITYGDDLFTVQTPNVMIIFDTSTSMENKPDGWPQLSGNAKGIDGKTYNFEQGGNHPNSKLYQAKLALSQILDSVVKDRVNLGFSTYAQFKTDIRRGYYSRDRRDYTAPTSDQYRWDKLYWRFNNYAHGSWTSNSFQKDSFTDAWGILRAGVTVGYTFTIPHWFDHSWNNDKQNVPPPHPPGQYLGDLKITVSSIVYSPEINWYAFTYSSVAHDHYEEAWSSLYYPTNAAINCDVKFLKISGTYKTYDSKDAQQKNNPAKWACKGPTLVAGTAGGYSSWYKEYAWLQFSATSCPATNGADNFPVNATQTSHWSVVGSCYDYSAYAYPADGTNNKPHTWSYFKVDNKGYWPNNKQTPNYPSVDGAGKLNLTPGTNDDHFNFINFPDDKDKINFHDSDRTTITNLIKSFLDLTPVKSPESGLYWTKLPLHDTYGRKGLTGNTTASSFTPLADSLSDAYRYFYDYIYNYRCDSCSVKGDSSSTEKFGDTLCRGNYVIVLTDGLESCRFQGQNPDYNAAPTEAANLLSINVKTFVIGFGMDIVGNQTLNNIAVSGGTGKAYYATDLNSLKGALQSIFQVITGFYYGRSNPVITRARDRLYKGSFDNKDGYFRGHLHAWDADKQTGVLAPDFVWDAGEIMNTNGRGKVYTWTDASPNPARVEFQDNLSLYSLVNPLGDDSNNDGKVDNKDAVGVIKFTLDSNYDDCVDGIIDKVTLTCHGPGHYQGKRAIDWKLGDIYHSTPVVIAEPAFYFSDSNYQQFYNDNKNRETLIYVGTNDGMLHALKNTDGSEKFAIIPKNLLGGLKNLSVTHQFYVDSSPKAYDVCVSNCSKATDWRTVLVSGQRGGGPYYFAVDVTYPSNPQILWEWTDASLGDTWAKPDIGKVMIGGQAKYVAFLTGGYSQTNGKGNSFHIVNIEDGSVLKSFTVGGSTNKIPASPTAFDADQDGYIDSVYFGDTTGTLWKVDVTNTDTSKWALNQFFTPNGSKKRPIFYSPAVVKNDQGTTLVYFGTGNENDLTSQTDNYFYEIEDQGATGKESWSQALVTGEKVLASPSVANNIVYFTTWIYQSDSSFCGAGEGKLWGLKVTNSTQTGGVAGLVTLDTNTGKWTDAQKNMSLGAGIPTAPVVTNGMVYVSTSLNANKVIQVPVPPWARASIKSWREVTK